MISTLLDHLFQRSNVPSGSQVKQRLKFVLAHDRAAIEPQVFENMRHEIMRVVSKYVELDEGSLDIRLESDKRMTALIANLPIKMVKEELPDLIALFDESVVPANAAPDADFLILEMDRLADEALDAIAETESIKPAPENLTPDSIAKIADRTTEVTQKLRTAANKSQNEAPNQDAENVTIPVIADVLDDLLERRITNATDNNADETEKIEDAKDESPEGEDPEGDQLELSLGLPESSAEIENLEA